MKKTSYNWDILFSIASNLNRSDELVIITGARCPGCGYETLNIKYKDSSFVSTPDVVVCSNEQCDYHDPYVTINLLSDVSKPYEHTYLLHSTLIDDNGKNVFKNMSPELDSIPVASQKTTANRPFMPLDLANAVRDELTKVEIRKGNFARTSLDEEKLKEEGRGPTWPFDMSKEELISHLSHPPDDVEIDDPVVTASIERVDDKRVEKLLETLQGINGTLEKAMSPNQVYDKYHEILKIVRKNKDIIDVRLLNDVASNITTLYDFLSHHYVDKIERSRYKTALQGYLGSFLIRVTDVVARLLHNEPTHKEPDESWHARSLTPDQYKGKTTRSFGKPIASIVSKLVIADENNDTLTAKDIKQIYSFLRIKAMRKKANGLVSSLDCNYQKYNDFKIIYKANNVLPSGFEALANSTYHDLKQSFVEATEALK